MLCIGWWTLSLFYPYILGMGASRLIKLFDRIKSCSYEKFSYEKFFLKVNIIMTDPAVYL